MSEIRVVDKGWGREEIVVSTDQYCMKRLCFDLEGSRTSMHFHMMKDETFFVEQGSFRLDLIQTKDGKTYSVEMNVGDHMRIDPLLPHRLTSLEEDSVMIEVSTADDEHDNFRIYPGDSQEQ
jgi:mannose-6-phosphate isomerase-like protein (cupin superfamily)